MDTRTQDKITGQSQPVDEVVPQAPQPVSPAPEADVYAWQPRHQTTPFYLVGEEDDDEPTPDVGGEVGKTPRLLTAWQITGLVLGGIALAAGAAYLVRRRA